MENKNLKIIRYTVYILLIPVAIAVIFGFIGYKTAMPILFSCICILLIIQAIATYKQNKKGLTILSIISSIFAIIAIFYIINL